MRERVRGTRIWLDKSIVTVAVCEECGHQWLSWSNKDVTAHWKHHPNALTWDVARIPETCCRTGCSNKAHGQGLCRRHYHQRYDHARNAA